MKNYPGFLNLLIYIIGIFDPYGTQHSERVTFLAMNLARRAGISDDSQDMDDIELAGLLHDIGKIGIPETIRRMPGRFTLPERMIMEQHSVIGTELLVKVPNGGLSNNMKLIVKHHHENWSGNGYPDGISGETIPLGARILRICDTYDALTHDRGYQRAMKKPEALRLMMDEQVKEAWADPRLLGLFLEMMKD